MVSVSVPPSRMVRRVPSASVRVMTDAPPKESTRPSSVLAHVAFFGLPASALWGAAGMGALALPLARSMRPRSRTAAGG